MKSESKKVFTILIVLNLLVLISIGLVITLIYKNYKNSLEIKKQSMNELAKVADLASLKKITSETNDGRQYIESLFVDKDKIIDFLGFIESLGNLSGAEVKVISVDEGSSENPTDYTTIRFEAAGAWAQVFKTVSLIDHISTAISVSDLQISKSYVSNGKKGPVSSWVASMNVRVLKPRK